MNAFPSPTEIVDSLKQSGYLMEQEVATQMQACSLYPKRRKWDIRLQPVCSLFPDQSRSERRDRVVLWNLPLKDRRS